MLPSRARLPQVNELPHPSKMSLKTPPNGVKVSRFRAEKNTYSLPTHESQHRDGNIPHLPQTSRQAWPATSTCPRPAPRWNPAVPPLRSARPPHTHTHHPGSLTPPRAPSTDPEPRALTLLLRLGRHLGQAEAERGLPRRAARAYTPKSRGSKKESPLPRRPNSRDTFRACR